MRTTIDVDKALLDDVVRLTGERSMSKAVGRALEEFVYARAVERLRSLAGRIDIEDNWREMEEEEIAEYDRESAQNASDR
ncbi:MAG: type II toxin-antitoxin system VapB family antitoxin [Chloroflexi bacterium]|nr:type II toxin-antitoxin system VapB family antitoxin [Chloroflexota bacterium]